MSFLNFDINFNIDNFPIEIGDLDKENNEKLKINFTGNDQNRVLVGPKKYCFSETYKKLGPMYYNLPIKPNDVWLFGFQRSGTTLMQEMIWLICNDLNFEQAQRPITVRFQFLEQTLIESLINVDRIKNHLLTYQTNEENRKAQNIFDLLMQGSQFWKYLTETRERRFIKTHLPISLVNPDVLKSGCKVIYIIRNPKDVLVSNYHYDKVMKFTQFNGSLNDYWKYFRENLCMWTPYYEHITEAWENRHNPNFLFLFYEEILQDMKKALMQISSFLEKPLDEIQINKLANHLQFDNFRKNNSVNHSFMRKIGLMDDQDNLFIRKGKVNGWQDEFTEEMNAEFDEWFGKNMKRCGLHKKLFG